MDAGMHPSLVSNEDNELLSLSRSELSLSTHGIGMGGAMNAMAVGVGGGMSMAGGQGRDPGVTAAVLATLGELAVVGPEAIAPHLDAIMPVIIDSIKVS